MVDFSKDRNMALFFLFYVSFLTGYVFTTNGLSGTTPELLYANIEQIDAIKIGQWTNTSILSGLTRAISLDYHYNKGLIFWTDVMEMKISVVHIDTLHPITEDIIRTRISRPDGIAIDWIYNHLYWTDDVYHHIEVSNLDGSMRRILIDYGIERPRALALNPVHGYMFFSDWGSVPRIERCGLDGNNRQIIVITDIAWPNGLTIDHEEQRLYWTDGIRYQIKSSDMDGSNIKTVVKSSEYLPHPFGIAIYQKKVYWTNWEHKSLLRTDKQDGKVVEIVRSDLKSPMDLKVYYSEVQQSTDDHVCGYFNGGCSHLCLPSAPWSGNKKQYSCMCQDGYGLSSNNLTCSYNGRNVQLLIAEHQGISKIDLDTLKLENLNLPNMLNAVAVDFHFEKDLIFWTDVALKNIFVSYLSGGLISGLGIRKSVVAEKIMTPDGLAVDWIYDHLYWTDTGYNHIQVANLDGTHRKTLINTELDEPRAIVLIPEEGIMFYTDWGIIPKIERSAMDGSQRKVIVSKNVKWPNGIVIDINARRIYWTDGYLQTIRSATFDGSDVYVVADFPSKSWPQPFGIDIFEDKIYWSNWNMKNIYSIHKYKGTDLKPLVTGLKAPRNIKFLSKSKQSRTEGSNVCGKTNGGCHHLCLPVPFSSDRRGYTCTCADMYALKDKAVCIKRGPTKVVKEEL